MEKMYASPFRVYLALAGLALVGIFSAFKLPVSLFPNSNKPKIQVYLNYGSSTAQEFINTYGTDLEHQLRSLATPGLEVDRLFANYDQSNVRYEVAFKWGAEPRAAQKEIENVVNSFGGRLPEEIRLSLRVNQDNDNGGFYAASFYSSQRSLDELYELLEPVLGPKAAKVPDAVDAGLFNPTEKEIRVDLDADKMASLQIVPRDLDRAMERFLGGYSAGSMTIGTRQYQMQMPRPIERVEDLNRVLISSSSGQILHLTDIAKVDFGPKSNSRNSFKTNGAPSLILFASPRPGGNVKRMADDLNQIIAEALPSLPKDVQFRILVDPSEFIRTAVNNVFHEVALGALLAVAVLFIFIGSFRNTVTAAIEIPLSMVLAFILMRLSGMNLNLISLGGLALSAGMNVDASVVVMENIFRHFDERPGPHSYAEKLAIISRAVSEVRFAVIASTLASLVVFLPLAFTSDLSYAVLGDLAKTVVFSHGFSMFVALILVPTVRLQLMSRTQGEHHVHSPFERQIQWLESWYGRALGKFIARPKLQWATYVGLMALLGLLLATVLPKLPKEIIGKPDTDWIILGFNTRGNTLVRQMEATSDEVENRMMDQFGKEILYTFAQIKGPNRATIMARIRSKKDMRRIRKEMDAFFTNTPFVKYWSDVWNPAELPIPNPPDLDLVVRGGTLEEQAETTRQLEELLDDKLPYRIDTNPDVGRIENIVLRPQLDQWFLLKSKGVGMNHGDLADLARVATTGRRVGRMEVGGRTTDVMLHFPNGSLQTVEQLAALPVGINGKIVPFRALVQVNREPVAPTTYREDERTLFAISGRLDNGPHDPATTLLKAQELVANWKKSSALPSIPYFEDAKRDLHEALHQLGTAVGLSILLILLTLILQFGSLGNALLVLVAVPLGFIGVLVSLFLFNSTLSLNSALGVILLNGIAVANSIILVDFLKRRVEDGLSPSEAAVDAGRKRLRPILITSLCTILGMLPIALGLGEGGRILQPLGIAVSGGLWVSMALTLFVVPALQVKYLNRQQRRKSQRAGGHPPLPFKPETVPTALTHTSPHLEIKTESEPQGHST